MYKYVQKNEKEGWFPVKSEEADQRITEWNAKRVTILEVSEIVDDDNAARDKKSYSYKGPLYFDIDCKTDLPLAIESGRRLAQKLVDLGVPKHGVRIYASGSKGVHILVDQRFFSSGRPIKALPLIYKSMAKELFVPGLDFAVYSCGKGNSFRVVNAKREDGKYRVPLLFDELETLTEERYRELTSKPRNVSLIDNVPIMCTLLADMFDAARKAVHSAVDQPKIIVTSKESLTAIKENVPPCIQQICNWHGIRAERNLNQVAMQLGIYLSRVKVSDTVADGLISRLADNSKSSKYDTVRARLEHVRGQIAYMEHSENYNFSCQSMRSLLEKPPCKGCSIEDQPEAGIAHQGLVEREDGMYVVGAKSDRMVTNFTMLPTDHYIELSRERGVMPRRIGTRMEMYDNGELVSTVMFNESSWLSRSAFMRDTTEGHGILTYYGTDNDVQAIKSLVLNKEKDLGEIYRVHTCGVLLDMVGDSELYTYVEPGMSINSNKVTGTHELATDIIARPYFAESNICSVGDDLADQTLLSLLECNQPLEIALMIGWFSACHLKTHISSLYNQFPILAIWGSAGAGKSAMIGIASWLNGTDYMMRDTPVNVSNITPYAILEYASSSTTVPRVMEEYNKSKMRSSTWKAVGEILKASWNSETVLRGVLADKGKSGTRTGASLSKIPISSPVCVISEQELDMPALQERSIRVRLSKEKRRGRKDALVFATKHREKLREVGKALMARSLQTSRKSVRELMDSVEEHLSFEITDRPRYSYQVCLVGLKFLQKVVEEDLKLTKSAAKLSECVQNMVSFFEDADDGVLSILTQSEVDAVLNEMNVMIGLSATADTPFLQKGIHYFYREATDEIIMDAVMCHAQYRVFLLRSTRNVPVIEKPEGFNDLLKDEPYFKRWEKFPGMGGDGMCAVLSKDGMRRKGVNVSHFE